MLPLPVYWIVLNICLNKVMFTIQLKQSIWPYWISDSDVIFTVQTKWWLSLWRGHSSLSLIMDGYLDAISPTEKGEPQTRDLPSRETTIILMHLGKLDHFLLFFRISMKRIYFNKNKIHYKNHRYKVNLLVKRIKRKEK